MHNSSGICVIKECSMSVSSGLPILPSPMSRIHDENCWICCFRALCDLVIEASSISNLEAFFFTGSVCLKSPPNIMLLPPNGVCGLSNMSLRHRSRASKQRQLFIGASSQMMRLWAALPDGNSNDDIPEDATAKTILSCKWRMHAIDFQRKVFPFVSLGKICNLFDGTEVFAGRTNLQYLDVYKLVSQ
ncbi:hypothetical protein Tco_1281480 [Tanacetum coccineum]